MTKTNHSPAQRAAMKHNSLIGLAVAIQKNAATIRDAETSSKSANLIAGDVLYHAKHLEQALRAGRKS